MINRGNAVRASLLALTLGALVKLNYPAGSDAPVDAVAGVATVALAKDVASITTAPPELGTPEDTGREMVASVTTLDSPGIRPDPAIGQNPIPRVALTSAAEHLIIPGWSWVIRRECLAVETTDQQTIKYWAFDALWIPCTSAPFEGAYWTSGDWEVAYIRRWDWTVFRRLEAGYWRFTVETGSSHAYPAQASYQAIPLQDSGLTESTVGVVESR